VSIEGKVAVVTGATSGVGRSTALVWAQRGAKVIACGRREELGKQLESEARDAGGDLTFVAADVSSAADCRRVIETAVSTYGRLDVLLNNAGIESDIVDFHALSEPQWDTVIDVNLKGTFLCSRYAVEQMVTQGEGGLLLHMASINAVEALAHMAPYNAAKAGVVQLSRTIAVEYLLHGIRSNAIILGGAEGDTASRTQDDIARYLRGPDYVRPAEPDPMAALLIQKGEDIGAFLALLAHDDARLLTGATIALDRAMTAGFTSSMTIHMTTAGLWGAPS
jgi:NAD(P)-dependent dehydrogenase (short-subunit alcohol dehydrogenase family)